MRLLDSLPLGLALADTDGRFIFLNKVFRKAVGLGASERPTWPGDLVVDEDKAAVSDAVRRFGRGRPMSGDLAVRLKSNAEEPVAMTVAGARGLGNAAVLLSIKDNSEEARLKREIAQATKMQAVGQLAGGVAHDFNNILTAILGTCDLMMMRHAPGDSDYDDIQQIRSNSADRRGQHAGSRRQLCGPGEDAADPYRGRRQHQLHAEGRRHHHRPGRHEDAARAGGDTGVATSGGHHDVDAPS